MADTEIRPGQVVWCWGDDTCDHTYRGLVIEAEPPRWYRVRFTFGTVWVPGGWLLVDASQLVRLPD